MAESITSEEQITSGWLTERLRRNGHLARGVVSLLGIDRFKTIFSNIYRLEVAYSLDAAPSLPTKLILKVPLPG